MTPEYVYTRRFFDPGVKVEVARDDALQGGDRPEKSPYLYDPDIILAVNVAMAANRPLLVAGPPGSGKSSLAGNIAAQKGWAYGQKVITSRTEARDLLWRFDAIERLHDARALGENAELDPAKYIKKEVLWRAFEGAEGHRRTVVLLDEIDKADPDLPNGLLETLGLGTFYVDELRRTIKINEDARPFIVITTNNERELSRPFVRRCVTLVLPPPSEQRLLGIAETWNLASGDDRVVAEALAKEVAVLAADARARADAMPSAAEFLDALRTCLQLGIRPGAAEWEAVRTATLTKRIELERDGDAAP